MTRFAYPKRQWIKLQAVTERERVLRWALEQALAVKDREVFQFILFFLKPISRSFQKQFEFSLFFFDKPLIQVNQMQRRHICSNMFLPYDIFYLKKILFFLCFMSTKNTRLSQFLLF